MQFLEGNAPTSSEESEQDEGLQKKLEAFLRALREGREAYSEIESDPEETSFSVLGMAPNAARISIRFFHQGSVAELLNNLRRHYEDIAISPRPRRGSPLDSEFPPTWRLLGQTARAAKDIPPVLGGALLKAVLTGSAYPQALFSAALRRVRADQTVNFERCCIFKGYLNRNLRRDVSMSLDIDRADPAYRLGRLFSALEKTQTDALGDGLNRTIRDSFYSSASATPRIIFPRLITLHQHHLAKLEGGRRVNRDRLVQEILAPLETFPAHLGLADQALFALGYYHQRQDFYTPRKEATQGQTTSEGTTA